MSPYALKVKIKDGHSFKVLAELIQKYINKDGCITADKNGLKLTGVDTKTPNGTKLICVDLPKTNFTSYTCSSEPLHIGLNIVHFYRMLRPIKKKDNALTLYIEKDDPLKLFIQINQAGEDKKKGILGHINITLIRPVTHQQPTGYGDPIVIHSKEFQKIKQLNKISNTLELTCKGKLINLFCDREGVYSKSVVLGEIDDEDIETPENEDENEFRQTYSSDQILDLVKLASTSTNIQIYLSPDLPLYLRMSAGSLGFVDIYLKSKESIKEEEEDNDENEEIITLNEIDIKK